MASAFTSSEGSAEQSFPPLSEQPAWDDADMTNINTSKLQLIPDPPCIAHMDDAAESPVVKQTMYGNPPQTYFKDHATWQNDDPAMRAARASAKAFVQLWEKQCSMLLASSSLGKKADANAMVPKVSKRTSIVNYNKGNGEGIVCEAIVNISPHSIGIRSACMMDESLKTGHVLSSGQCAVIDAVQEHEGVRFFRLADGRGWVFDSKDGDSLIAKLEELESVVTWHRVTSKEVIDIRSTPVYDANARTGRLLCPGELVVVDLKARIRGQTFVHLADGRGWVFALSAPQEKEGEHSKTRSAYFLIEECDGEVTNGDKEADALSKLPPTNHVVEVGLWTYIVGYDPVLAVGGACHGTFIEPGDIIKVDKRAVADGMGEQGAVKGRMWLRLADGRGWVPERSLKGKDLVSLRTEQILTYPSHFRGMNNFDKPVASWVTGVA